MRLIDKDATIKALKEDPIGFKLAAKNNVDGWIAARPDVEAITVEWITKYMRSLKSGTFADPAWIIKTMLEEWREEQEHDLMD